MDREPAFEQHPDWPVAMDLRDWFAGHVVGELIRLTQNHSGEWDIVAAAAHAYMVADAMMEARKR